MLRFLKANEQAPLPDLVNIGVVDNPSPLFDEVLNLLTPALRESRRPRPRAGNRRSEDSSHRRSGDQELIGFSRKAS
jgi:hypothetical protein